MNLNRPYDLLKEILSVGSLLLIVYVGACRSVHRDGELLIDHRTIAMVIPDATWPDVDMPKQIEFAKMATISLECTRQREIANNGDLRLVQRKVHLSEREERELRRIILDGLIDYSAEVEKTRTSNGEPERYWSGLIEYSFRLTLSNGTDSRTGWLHISCGDARDDCARFGSNWMVGWFESRTDFPSFPLSPEHLARLEGLLRRVCPRE